MKNMILNNQPTVGPDGLFESGGQVSIKAIKRGSNVPIPFNPQFGLVDVAMPIKNVSLARFPNFPVWVGSQGVDSSNSWSQVRRDSILIGTSSVENSIVKSFPENDGLYNSFSINNFGTFNLDYYYYLDLPKTNVYIKVPELVTLNNSVCYLAFPAINSVASLRTFDPVKNQFTLGLYEIPIGLKAKVVFISKHKGKYYSAIESITVTKDLTIPLILKETTLDAFKASLGEL